MKRTILLVSLGCLVALAARGQEKDWQQLVNRKQFAAVIEQAGQLTAADSANYTTLYAIGQAYDGLLDYRAAYRYFQLCFALDSTQTDLLNTLARTAINLGRSADAERFYSRVLESDSSDFYANYQLARLYQQVGDYDQALNRYDALLAQYPGHTSILRNLGDIHLAMENATKAYMAYFLAYNGNRENALLAHSLINTMLRIGSYDRPFVDEALIVCDTALTYNPNHILLRRDKAMGYYMSRRFAEADSVYTALLAEGDSTYLTLKYGGSSKYYAGMYMDAIQPLTRAYAMDTTSVDTNILLGAALGRTYDRKRAYELFDQAEQLMKPSETLTTLLDQSRAETYRRDGRTQDAIRLYYQMWQQTDRGDYLMALSNLASPPAKVTDYPSPDSRQRGLYLTLLYINTRLKNGSSPKYMYHYHPFLTSLYEDMFFRNVTEEPLLAPDGKKSTLHIMDLRQLLNQIPDRAPTREEHEELLRQDREKRQRERAAQAEPAPQGGE